MLSLLRISSNRKILNCINIFSSLILELVLSLLEQVRDCCKLLTINNIECVPKWKENMQVKVFTGVFGTQKSVRLTRKIYKAICENNLHEHTCV